MILIRDYHSDSCSAKESVATVVWLLPINATHCDFYALIILFYPWSVLIPPYLPARNILENLLTNWHLIVKIFSPYRKLPKDLYSFSTELNMKTKVTIVEGDILDTQSLRRACQGISVVIHTAAVIDVSGVLPAQTIMEVNLKGRAACEQHAPGGKRKW